jgi:hypothetical protein
MAPKLKVAGRAKTATLVLTNATEGAATTKQKETAPKATKAPRQKTGTPRAIKRKLILKVDHAHGPASHIASATFARETTEAIAAMAWDLTRRAIAEALRAANGGCVTYEMLTAALQSRVVPVGPPHAPKKTRAPRAKKAKATSPSDVEDEDSI